MSGLADLKELADYLKVDMPVFFDPVTGETKTRVQDIRGDDYYLAGEDTHRGGLCVAAAVIRLSDCSNMLAEAEDRRRDSWGQCRDLRASLQSLVNAIEYTHGGVLNQEVADAYKESKDLLDRLGVETYEGEPE